ncbi:MAG: Asp23/Gls24 family envelope stress response protein [Bacillota bacterium]|nr:Asp23/Gls24 family envelope stress response protein [Bacillota bacterium]NLM07817.1 Asp23/Gls24 family envelope stress response protein [Clostridiales Family XIII bacterium]
MALYLHETEAGTIKIQRAVIGRIVIEAVRKFQGRVLITSRKGKPVRIKHKHGIPYATDYFDISMGEKGLDIRIYIAIRFGTSIGSVTEQLISDIKADIEKLASIAVNSIAINVTCMISKQIARRNIEVKG